MWPFKSKYEKLTREDINDAICKLEIESKKIDQAILDYGKQIDDITLLAKKEKTREVKINYIKKINFLKRRRDAVAKRNSYLLYNIELMEKLKMTIEDNQLIKLTNGMSLNKLLADQAGLRKFLMKSLNIKQQSEQSMVSTNESFESVEELHEEPNEIYGKSSSDDELLASFEKEEGIADTLLEENAKTDNANEGESHEPKNE